jgi:hypothetical protein
MWSLTHVNLPLYAVPVRQYRSLQSCFLHCLPRGKPACNLLCAFRIRTSGTCTPWIIKLNSHLKFSRAMLGTHSMLAPGGGFGVLSKFLYFYSVRCRGQVAGFKTPPPGRKHQRCAQCRGTVNCASNTGTFACHTFPRDTKASKRA